MPFLFGVQADFFSFLAWGNNLRICVESTFDWTACAFFYKKFCTVFCEFFNAPPTLGVNALFLRAG